MKQLVVLEPNLDWHRLPDFLPLLTPLAQQILTGFGFERDFDILSKRYGLQDKKTYTLQEIGDFYGVERERIRQIEQRALETLRITLFGKNPRVIIPPELVGLFQRLRIELCQLGPVITLREVVEKVQLISNITFNKNLPELHLLLSVYSFERLRENSLRPETSVFPSWLTDDCIKKADLFDTQTRIDNILVDTVIPLSFFDLVVRINKGRKNKISQELIRLSLKTLPHVESVTTDCYQIKIEHLRSIADKAYRILAEHKKPMKIAEIHKELYHRLSKVGENPQIPIRSISQQLNIDSRFTPIGKAGWILKEWPGFSTSSTVDFIREYLYQKKEAATLLEIYDFVITKRTDVKIGSIRSFLAQKDKFTRVTEDRFVPAEWKWEPYTPIRSSRKSVEGTLRNQIQDAVHEYLRFRKNEWVKISELKAYVLKKCSCKIPTFYSYLSDMTDVIKETRTDGVYCHLLDTINDDNKIDDQKDWAKIIALGESKTVEFKRAAKWNDFEKKADGSMIQQVVIEVAGFMNGNFPGRIFIGVDDKTRGLLGIEDDIKIADKGKQNPDGYTLFLSNSISSKLGNDLSSYYDIEYQVIEDKTICCISVKPAQRIVYYEGNLYLRGSSQTNRLTAAEAVGYVRLREKNRGDQS